MIKKIKISEQKIHKIINLVLNEMVDLNDYQEEDFYDAYFNLFRKWITEKLGEDVKKYPTSYLLKKYSTQFEKQLTGDDNDIEDDNDNDFNDDYSRFDYYRTKKFIGDLVKKGKFTLPSMAPEKKFTEKYEKILPSIIEALAIPEYVSLSFEEEKTNKVWMRPIVDFVKMIHSKENRSVSTNTILTNLKKYLTNFAGVEFGNPLYGKLELNSFDLNYIGLDEWVKNVLNKKIKKEIRKLPHADIINKIGFNVSRGIATLKIYTKTWKNRPELSKEIKEYLTNLGLNSNIFQLEID